MKTEKTDAGQKTLLTSMEVRELLGISSYELMHLREAGEMSAIRMDCSP